MVPAAVVSMGKMRGRVSAATKHRLVAADRRHGGERVHALARVVRGISSTEKDSHAGGGDLLASFSPSPAAAGSRSASGLYAKQRQVVFSVDVVRAVAEDLGDDVGGGEDGGAVRTMFAPFSV